MITINVNKAKDIAHNIRRDKRTKEFKPYDEIIMKQIPNTNLTEVEAARQTIREKYVVIQEEINNATNVNELKTIIDSI